jgi:ArsR family transcriptional regulator
MDEKRQALYQAQATVMKAMAHPTRLFIVDQLSRGEQNVGDLTSMIRSDVSTVSKHLSVLKNAGIITDEKRGTQVFYTLGMPCVMNFFSCLQSVIRSKADDQLNLLK